jgi:uncharacterized protein (DUF952 family)
MVDGGHVGHQVRGRYRSAEQIEHAVAGLRRGDFLVLECGTVEDCYAQTRLTPEGVYDVEYRDGSPARHYWIQTASPAQVSSVLAAWAGARPDWSTAFEWTCIGSMFTGEEQAADEAVPGFGVPNARPVGGARRNGREPIFHIALGPNWAAARTAGEYRFSTRDATLDDVGFIHACFADQVETIAGAFFSADDDAPVVLVIDEDKLSAPVRIEHAADAEDFFPHIYGPLPVGAVSNILELRRDPRTGMDLHWPYYASWRQPVPDRVPVAWEEGYRTDLIGRYDAGLFFAGYSGSTFLHLFDAHGVHRRSWIAPAEHVLGEDAAPSALVDHLRGLVENLPGSEFADIAIAPFAVEDAAGERWGLIDETVGNGFPHAELRPNQLGFHPPWNGEYDT